MCGGTRYAHTCLAGREGLSPRVRGNRGLEAGLDGLERSIPACAGEPFDSASAPKTMGVYPRVCGGTAAASVRRPWRAGLSPRVRGNPRPVSRRYRPRGSIPACAGEPDVRAGPWTPARVYPRVCGGTRRRCGSRLWVEGLSPRVRGNHGRSRERKSCSRSIPACAGEPRSSAPVKTISRVYPRVCGGTDVRRDGVGRLAGLSPRVRGNPHPEAGVDVDRGSIPACAGEPGAVAAVGVAREVYPRVCGGTIEISYPDPRATGLSPRVRGNPTSTTCPGSTPWSIPACAGEPQADRPLDRW